MFQAAAAAMVQMQLRQLGRQVQKPTCHAMEAERPRKQRFLEGSFEPDCVVLQRCSTKTLGSCQLPCFGQQPLILLSQAAKRPKKEAALLQARRSAVEDCPGDLRHLLNRLSPQRMQWMEPMMTKTTMLIALVILTLQHLHQVGGSRCVRPRHVVSARNDREAARPSRLRRKLAVGAIPIPARAK